MQILLQQETQLDQPSNPHLLKVVQWLESRLKDNQKNTRSLAILYMRAESWDTCGQYIDKAGYTWTPSDVGTQTIEFITGVLGYSLEATDSVIIKGRWA